jgi:hypothetical protein
LYPTAEVDRDLIDLAPQSPTRSEGYLRDRLSFFRLHRAGVSTPIRIPSCEMECPRLSHARESVEPSRHSLGDATMKRYFAAGVGLLCSLSWLRGQELPAPEMPPPPPPAIMTVDDLATPPSSNPAPGKDGGSAGNGGNGNGQEEPLQGCFPCRFFQAYVNEFRKAGDPILDPKWRREQDENAIKEMNTYYNEGPQALDPPRRALPAFCPSPPFPSSEYQGYPLIGVPESTTLYPFMKAIYAADAPWSEAIKDSRIKFTGWVTAEGNWSNAHNSNTPDSYWIVPNKMNLDQVILKLERYADTVQTDHIDWGFRSVCMYGMDYRYTMAGGWGSDQLLKNNLLYGWDPTEQYVNVYIPFFLGGTDIRVGRWIACPDIETQYSVDNYLGTHSLLFTVDTYTQTGVMVSQKINDQWMLQAAIHAGTDMAPWYQGAIPTGAFGARWVSKDNNDSFYTWLNAINDAQFRHFVTDGVPAGHDNFNYFVTTWQHRFTPMCFTKTEAYYMWQYNAELGGTPSLGPLQPYGGGGGDGVLLPGRSNHYGVLNYTMFGLSKRDYMTVRNEWVKDERGMRFGFPGNYTSHTIGWSHQFNDVLMLRPEIGYYRNWNNPAFDLGTRQGIWIYGFDVTLRW